MSKIHATLTKLSISLFFIYSICISAIAQTTVLPNQPTGTWFIGTVAVPSGSKRWNGFGEIQARSNDLFRQYFYNELKGGIGYELSPTFTFSLAGGRYATYDHNDLSTGPQIIELRLWQQLVINQLLNRVKFEHRYRNEQRWSDFRDGSRSYRNRIRYRLNTFVPINNRTITDRTFFLSIYDEIFLNPKGPFFERNRLYAGLGYQVNKLFTLQTGLVNQLNYNPASFGNGIFVPQSASSKNNIVIQVTYRLLRKKNGANSTEKLPSQPD